MTRPTSSTGTRPPGSRWPAGQTLLRAAGNLLLGACLGLLAQYAVTDLVNASEQRALKSEMARAGVGVAAGDDATAARQTLDLAGWAREDAAYWRASREGDLFGRLVIERMGLDCAVVKGAEPADLRRGPGWIPGTDLPGGTGNVGIAGHRTTYGSPFGRIDELVPGDLIRLYSPFRRYTYEVTRTLIVTPEQVEVIAHTTEPQLTLSACHPRYSARFRYIVQAKLVGVRRTDARRSQ